MTITAIHHVQITIPPRCEAHAREFYCGVLGMAEIEKPDSLKSRGGFWLKAGDRHLHIGVEDGARRSATKAHIAYQVDDLERWRVRLGAEGVPVIDGIPIPGFRRFEFRDPFGNRIEFIQPEA